jgi:hypothetical protein
VLPERAGGVMPNHPTIATTARPRQTFVNTLRRTRASKSGQVAVVEQLPIELLPGATNGLAYATERHYFEGKDCCEKN